LDFLNELNFEKEKQKLLKKYDCETLDEVIAVLKKKIKENNEFKKESRQL